MSGPVNAETKITCKAPAERIRLEQHTTANQHRCSHALFNLGVETGPFERYPDTHPDIYSMDTYPIGYLPDGQLPNLTFTRLDIYPT